jgi:AraC family transcriptional regulator
MDEPNPPAPDPAPRAALAAGVGAYGRALSGAGGTQIEALMRNDDGAALCAALYTSPAYDLRLPPLAVSRLSITLTAAPVHGGIDGASFRSYRSPRHALFLTPAGAAATWRKELPSRHINLYFHPQALEGGVAEVGRLDAQQPLLNQRIPGLGALIERLAHELQQPQPWASEAADSLGRLLLVQLARLPAGAPRPRHALSPAMLARLRAYIQAHLTERILVSDLARVAGLGANHFAHAYTRATGQAPHQAVLRERLQHALHLLRHSRLSLAEVALASGFASQQHLTHTMKRRLGHTPGQVRRGSEARP